MCPTITDLKKIVKCPDCYGTLNWNSDSVVCPKCDLTWAIVDGRPVFCEDRTVSSRDSRFQQEQMFNNSLTAKIFNAGSRLVNSSYKPIDHLKVFFSQIEKDSVVVELGSGNRRLMDHIVNIDLFPFENVDVVANIEKLPIENKSVDYIVMDAVLEHLKSPATAVKEMYRVLRPNGKALCICPFIFPYHGYPAHYCNFTKDGIETLFEEFSECSVQMYIGPTSAITNIISEYFALAMSGKSVFIYTLLKGMFLLPIFYFKFIDYFWRESEKANRISSVMCAHIVK